jgi:hypothetical protein
MVAETLRRLRTPGHLGVGDANSLTLTGCPAGLTPLFVDKGRRQRPPGVAATPSNSTSRPPPTEAGDSRDWVGPPVASLRNGARNASRVRLTQPSEPERFRYRAAPGDHCRNSPRPWASSGGGPCLRGGAGGRADQGDGHRRGAHGCSLGSDQARTAGVTAGANTCADRRGWTWRDDK